MALADIASPDDVVARSNGTIEAGDERLDPYLTDVLAESALYAPCLQRDDLSDLKIAQARTLVCDAVLRRFKRDNEPVTDPGLTAEIWTAGPMARTLNYSPRTTPGCRC